MSIVIRNQLNNICKKYAQLAIEHGATKEQVLTVIRRLRTELNKKVMRHEFVSVTPLLKQIHMEVIGKSKKDEIQPDQHSVP